MVQTQMASKAIAIRETGIGLYEFIDSVAWS